MKNLIVGMVGTLLIASQAVALPLTKVANPWRENKVGEPGLFTILDELYGWNNLQRIHDDADNVWWNPTGHVKATAKYAGYDGELWYEGDSTKLLLGIKQGTPPGGDFKANDWIVNACDWGADGWVDLPKASGEHFTWRLTANRGTRTYFSTEWENESDYDHMVTFKIIGKEGATDNTIGNYVIAWEDFLGLGDKDYQDFVFEVASVAPVPETSSALLWLSVAAAFGVGCWFRRKRELIR